MNLPAASRGVSVNDKFYPNAVPLNLSGTGIKSGRFRNLHRKFIVIYVICEIWGLKHKASNYFAYTG